MTDAEVLNKVKTIIYGSSEGTFRDDQTQLYIDEVKAFMKDAGVSEETLSSLSSVGVIAIGVNDLYNYQSGGVRFSEYFNQRVIQLAGG